VKDARDILSTYARPSTEDPGGWELKPGEGRFEVTMSDPLRAHLKEQTVGEAIRTLERRVNVLGVAEPIIAKHGSTGDQILIQLPGVTNPESAKRVIERTAQLALKLVEKSDSSRDALLRDLGGKVPDSMEVLPGKGEEAGRPMFYLVKKEAVITGRDLKSARVGVDQFNQPAVSFTLKPYGASKFRDFTGRSIGRDLAIVLDGNVASAPRIEGKISDEGQITGRFTMEEAEELSKVLRAGALPASLKYLQELTVGASLGRDSIRSGVMASVGAMSFIAVFMLLYYRLSGLNAVVALTANLVILLGAMAYSAATLTLPGVAGVILTLGIGVDTNVLVFERIREELRNGKTVKAAIANGFERVWIVILDTHATALIAAAFLFQFGTGPIKGFAVTLVVGLLANILASYFVSKFLFEWILGKRQVATLSI
jgi:preprotein translocase subunit SecD